MSVRTQQTGSHSSQLWSVGDLTPLGKGKCVTRSEGEEKIERKGQNGQEGEKSWYPQFLCESYVPSLEMKFI